VTSPLIEAARLAAMAHYDRRTGELELEAQLLRAEETRPLGWRVIAHRAAIARRAYRAEMTDPEPAIPISVRRVE